jgi:hypothetical protein
VERVVSRVVVSVGVIVRENFSVPPCSKRKRKSLLVSKLDPRMRRMLELSRYTVRTEREETVGVSDEGGESGRVEVVPPPVTSTVTESVAILVMEFESTPP